MSAAVWPFLEFILAPVSIGFWMVLYPLVMLAQAALWRSGPSDERLCAVASAVHIAIAHGMIYLIMRVKGLW